MQWRERGGVTFDFGLWRGHTFDMEKMEGGHHTFDFESFNLNSIQLYILCSKIYISNTFSYNWETYFKVVFGCSRFFLCGDLVYVFDNLRDTQTL